jgi:hypothetical protein
MRLWFVLKPREWSTPSWDSYKWFLTHIVLPLAVVFTIVFIWWNYENWFLSEIQSQEKKGQHGDMFGGLNTLFSGLAFAGVLFAVFLQSRELSLQRQELIETRKEYRRAASANERTAEAQLMSARISAISTMLTAVNSAIDEEFTAGVREIEHQPSPIQLNKDNFRRRKELEGQLSLLLDQTSSALAVEQKTH